MAWVTVPCMLALLGLPFQALAQEESGLRPVTHGELWLSAAGSYKPFNKKTEKGAKEPLIEDLELIGELAWRNNLDPLASRYWYTVVGSKLKLTDFLKVGAEYRYSWEDRYTSNVSRLDLELRLDWKFGRWDLAHRFKYVHEFIPVGKLRTELRNRLGVEYDIPKWKLDPEFTAEAFTGLHYTGTSLVGMRYNLGTEFNLGKKTRSLGVAVRYDQEIGDDYPKNRWLLVIGFEQEFK